jgi:hypothetical protein
VYWQPYRLEIDPSWLSMAVSMLRQSALASAAGWDRTRLFYLLTKMLSRGYLKRE